MITYPHTVNANHRAPGGWYWWCSCGSRHDGYGGDERRCRDEGADHQNAHAAALGTLAVVFAETVVKPSLDAALAQTTDGTP